MTSTNALKPAVPDAEALSPSRRRRPAGPRTHGRPSTCMATFRVQAHALVDAHVALGRELRAFHLACQLGLPLEEHGQLGEVLVPAEQLLEAMRSSRPPTRTTSPATLEVTAERLNAR